MDALTISAASGLRSRMESLDMLANNLANSETGGYKSDREFYNLYISPEASQGEGQEPATLPVIERSWTDFSQGALHPTGNPFDLALSGKGFFAVDGPSGTLYTRNGGFRASKTGMLVTADGYPVRTAAGGSLQIPASGPIDVAADGSVRQNGQALGSLEIAEFADPGALAKRGAAYFTSASTPQPASQTTVEQGKLESSNVGAAESAVRLVGVMRQFEMLQKAVTLGSQMNRSTLQEVARVAS